jgi:hypothetical protein
MFRLRNLFFVPGIVLMGTAVASPNGSAKGCEASSYGACFPVHARYRIYTGDGQVALWPVGTHRLLGVVSGDEPMIKVLSGGNQDNMPEAANEYDVFGDFVVCPLDKEVPGSERAVCVKKAENLRRVRSSAR